MPRVVLAAVGVVVVPLAIVHRHSHFRRIAMVHIVAATVILVAPEVLRVVHVGVMVKPVPILRVVGASPVLSIGLLSFGAIGRKQSTETKDGGQGNRPAASHRNSPFGSS